MIKSNCTESNGPNTNKHKYNTTGYNYTGAAQNSNLLTISGPNFEAMAQCAQYAGSNGIVWTGVNKLGPDGYGGINEPWSLVSGEKLVLNDAIQLGDGYSDGNCAYMNSYFVISNTGFQCDAEFAFCCDPGLLS